MGNYLTHMVSIITAFIVSFHYYTEPPKNTIIEVDTSFSDWLDFMFHEFDYSDPKQFPYEERQYDDVA